MRISKLDSTVPGKEFNSKKVDGEFEGSFEDVADAVTKSSWSPSIFKDGKRTNKNFRASQMIALDFDSNTKVDDVKFKLNRMGLTYSLSYSRHHMKPKKNQGPEPRFRVIIPLSAPIKDPKTYQATWSHIAEHFPTLDAQCKDPARFFFASTHRENTVWGTSLDPIAPTVKSERKKVKNEKSAYPNLVIGCGVVKYWHECRSGIPGAWNTALHAAAKDAARSGIDKEVALHMLESMAPDPFDDKDVLCFNTNYNKGLSLKKVKAPSDGKIDREEVLETLQEEFKDNLIIIEDQFGTKGQFLENVGSGIVRAIKFQRVSDLVGTTLYPIYGLLDPHERDLFAKNWVTYTKGQEDVPKSLSFITDGEPAFHKVGFEPKPGPTPIFDEFISRLSDPLALQCFVWSLFEPLSYREQYLYLYGAGGDGKSTFSKFLEKLLGPTYVTKSGSSMFNNKFFASSFVGRRLCVFADLNSTRATTSETFKGLTGDDPIEVEAKYESAYMTKIDTKFMVLSNFVPQISGEEADIRRLMFVKIAPLKDGTKRDVRYIDRMWEEAPHILWKCKEMYEKHVVNHGEIPCDQMTTRELASMNDATKRNIFKAHFELDAEGELEKQAIYDIIDNDCKRKRVNPTEFVNWIVRTHDLKEGRASSKNRKLVIKGIKGKTWKK